MARATKIAKMLTVAPKQDKRIVEYSLAATAPDAFEASTRINTKAFSNDAAQVKGKKVPKVRVDLPTHTSTTAQRDAHRMARSSPSYSVLPPSPAKVERVGGIDFDAWDPEPQDESTAFQEAIPKVFTPTSRAAALKKQNQAVQNFNDGVRLVLESGVLTAVGSGHRLPVSTMNQHVEQEILSRVPYRPDCFSYSPVLRALQQSELQQVQVEYCEAAAKASVLYEIKDPADARDLGVDPHALFDESHLALWTNKEYQVQEWIVLRQTGIDGENVIRTFRVLESTLCSVLPVMLQVQHLWLMGSLPTQWWEAYSTSSAKCSYSKLLLTDVHLPKFQARLPMALEEFSNHIERYCEEIREALVEYWLSTAGTLLNNFEEQYLLNDTSAMNLYEESQPADEEYENDFEGITRDSNGEFNKFIAAQKGSEASKRAIKNRLAFEALDTTSDYSTSQSVNGRKERTSIAGSRRPNPSRRSRAARMHDSAAVLMSRQLREMCEGSLNAVANMFEQGYDQKKKHYSAFIIDLKLRKRDRKDIASDFSDPVEVCLQPDLDTIRTTLATVVRQLVAASRDFPRVEQKSASRSNMSTNQSKKLNDSSVSFTDSIVLSTIQKVHAAVTTFYEGPSNVVSHFSALESLMSGAEAARVEQAIAACTGNPNTVENLEALSVICEELETMIESIKTIAEDVCYFPIFEVRCHDLKELLGRYARSLHSKIMDAVVEENRNHMHNLCSQYQEIANTLVSEVADSSELKTLQDFTNKTSVQLSDLYDQYVSMCYERTKFVLDHRYKMSRDDIQVVFTTYNWPTNIQSYLRRSYENQAIRKRELEELLEEDQRKLENDLNDIFKRVELIAENSSPMEFRKIVERINAIKRDLESKRERAEEIAERESLLEMPFSEHLQRVDVIRENLEPLDRLWHTVKQFIEKTHNWHELPLAEVDAEDAQRVAEDLQRSLNKAYREFDRMGEKRQAAKRIAESMQSEVKDFLHDNIPLMLLICNQGMRDRHWAEIERLTGITIPKGDVVLNTTMMLELGLQHHVKDIEDVCVAANKEYGLQTALAKMENEWKDMVFETKSYRNTGTRILCSIDEIQQLLDDHIVKTQAMRGSRFIKPFIEQITRWEQTLVSMQDILDNWLKVQATWLYLEPIFSSDDIMRQMPTEGKMFRAVDSTWRESMAQTYEEPSCVKVARRPGFLEALIEANKKLEVIQKGLNDYLETKRLAFPRFFFLSNDELLEILAETKDPLRVQPHLKKCFDGISKLQFQSNLDITACFDPRGEKLDFPYEKVSHRKINPADSGGNVERWLIEVEAIMKKSVAYTIDFSLKDFLSSDRIEWLQRWQGQVIICVNQIRWCHEVEKVLLQGVTGMGLKGYYDVLCSELMRTVELVRGDIPSSLRTAIGALVVMDVHNRDTIHDMVQTDVQRKTDFDWLAQLRYYWKDDGYSAQSGMPGSIECRMINAMALYAYEYIGNQDRLVITPLTDRCYRTLMGAIHLNLGGAPEGPAGTGDSIFPMLSSLCCCANIFLAFADVLQVKLKQRRIWPKRLLFSVL